MRIKDPKKLATRRQRRGVSQAQLARAVNRSQQFISQLEQGTLKNCSKDAAEQIALWLDVDVEDYFEYREVERLSTVTTRSRVASRSA